MPNELHRKVYYVKEGMVKIGHYMHNGEEVVLDILKPGDVFGAIHLNHQNQVPEYAQSITDHTTLCNFDISKLEQILLKNPALALRYSKKVGEQQYSMTRRFSKIICMDARSRLIDFFYEWINQQTIDHESEIEFKNYLTHQDIASLNGLARQTVSTLLSQFKEEEILIFERNRIKIPNIDKLKNQLSITR